MQINNALEIPFPEGFRKMSENELAGLKMPEGGESVVLSNEEKHLIFTVGWKKAVFLGRMLSTRDLEATMGLLIRKAMKHLDYSETDAGDLEVGGETAEGFCYRYTAANGTEMSAASYALKKGNTSYYFHLYSRRQLESENIELVRRILGSARWI